MKLRTFGRLGWQVGRTRLRHVGHGRLVPGRTTASRWPRWNYRPRRASISSDTAQAYGDGHSEQLLGILVKGRPAKRVYAATEIPPKNRQWPSRRGVPLAQVFPPGVHSPIRGHQPLQPRRGTTIDLLQLHVWEDDWLDSGELAEDHFRAGSGGLPSAASGSA